MRMFAAARRTVWRSDFPRLVRIMRFSYARAAAAAPFVALAFATWACASSSSSPAAVATATDAAAPMSYVAASSDSCRRAQLRAEAEPEFRVMREAKPSRANAKPRFPLGEPKRRFQQVTVRFVVDTAGIVDMRTAEILTSSGKPFTDEVLLILPEWRFEPAELVPGCRVPFRFTSSIVFNAPGA